MAALRITIKKLITRLQRKLWTEVKFQKPILSSSTRVDLKASLADMMDGRITTNRHSRVSRSATDSFKRKWIPGRVTKVDDDMSKIRVRFSEPYRKVGRKSDVEITMAGPTQEDVADHISEYDPKDIHAPDGCKITTIIEASCGLGEHNDRDSRRKDVTREVQELLNGGVIRFGGQDMKHHFRMGYNGSIYSRHLFVKYEYQPEKVVKLNPSRSSQKRVSLLGKNLPKATITAVDKTAEEGVEWCRVKFDRSDGRYSSWYPFSELGVISKPIQANPAKPPSGSDSSSSSSNAAQQPQSTPGEANPITHRTCPTCNGNGNIPVDHAQQGEVPGVCSSCDGNKYIIQCWRSHDNPLDTRMPFPNNKTRLTDRQKCKMCNASLFARNMQDTFRLRKCKKCAIPK